MFEWKHFMKHLILKDFSVGFQYVPPEFFSYLMSHLCSMATTCPTDGANEGCQIRWRNLNGHPFRPSKIQSWNMILAPALDDKSFWPTLCIKMEWADPSESVGSYSKCLRNGFPVGTLGQKASQILLLIMKQGCWTLYIQDSLDQCPMPINADQNSGIDPKVNQFCSMPINADQFV